MIALEINPLYLMIGVPAALGGLLLGILLTWLIGRSRQNRMNEERDAAFDLANAKLTEAFADLSNRSLQANSDTFLKLAEQRMETQQERAKGELNEREKAVEALAGSQKEDRRGGPDIPGNGSCGRPGPA